MTTKTYGYVDRYRLNAQSKNYHQKVDAKREAQQLKMLFTAFSDDMRLMAIVEHDDSEGIAAYVSEGYAVETMNGDRPVRLLEVVDDEVKRQKNDQPKDVIVVSDDSVFAQICAVAADNHADVQVWLTGTQCPRLLAGYPHRHLAKMLPDLHLSEKTAAIWIDIENLLISLKKVGVKPSIKEFVEAIRVATSHLGNITTAVAYGDFGDLAKDFGTDLQRQLEAQHVETRYQISMHGKNSADMKIASDIHLSLERDAFTQTVVICTGDKDFRPTVEMARRKGKRVVVLAVKGSLSSDLERAVDEVRYLDDYLKPATRILNNSRQQVESSECTELLMRFTKLLNQNHWKWGHRKSLESVATPEQLNQALATGVLKYSRANESSGLTWNSEHPLAQAVQFWVPWITARVEYVLEHKVKAGVMRYVDTHYLYKGMLADPKCREFGIGQTHDDAAKWLSEAAKAEVLLKKRLPHHQEQGKMVDTWWIVEDCPVGQPKQPATAHAKAEEAEISVDNSSPTNCLPSTDAREQEAIHPQNASSQPSLTPVSTAY